MARRPSPPDYLPGRDHQHRLLKQIGGDTALGVFAIVNRPYSGLNMPQTGIVQGMQPLVAYNFGQQQFERVRKTIRV